MKPLVSPMTGPDWSLLREQIATIQAVARRRYGAAATFDQSLADLEILQRLVSDNVFDESETAELTAMGAVFGNVAQKQLDFEWVASEDQEGREPALRLKTSHALIVHPLRMIRLKVTSHAAVDMAKLYAAVKADAQKTKFL